MDSQFSSNFVDFTKKIISYNPRKPGHFDPMLSFVQGHEPQVAQPVTVVTVLPERRAAQR